MICPECNGRGETIYYVETDRDENSVTVEQRKGICRTCNGSGVKAQTNADRIRAMSDEELTMWLLQFVIDCAEKTTGEECEFEDGSEEELQAWLKQPADMRGEEDA